MAYVIAIGNQKGGVGKTTLAINFADLTRRFDGRRVILIDMNPQMHATSTYGAKSQGAYTILDVLKKDCSVEDAIQHLPMGDIIAGDKLLAQEKNYFESLMSRETRLRQALRKIDDQYDYIFIDTPPELDIFLINALTAADGCVIPIDPRKYSVEGLEDFMETVNDIKEELNESLKVYGLIVVRYENRRKHHVFIENLPEFAAKYNIPAFKTTIKTSEYIESAKEKEDKVAEDGTVIVANRSLLDNYGWTRAAKEYVEATEELIRKVEGL